MAVVVEQASDQDFTQLTDPYRRELYVHCYRMLGSVHDAEDLVQETYLRAWKGYDRFEGRSSLRTWLHRIATTACLTALEKRQRRPLPTGIGGPSDEPEAQLTENPEIPWLEPLPDDPGSVVTTRESVRLAWIAALQYLQPRQRAVLIMREVLRFSAAEVADTLGTTVPAVNSLLQRARAQLDQHTPDEEDLTELAPEQRTTLARYVAAFESYDISALTDLFTADAVFEMPPFATWVRGGARTVRLIRAHCPAQQAGDLLTVPASANNQPALGMYLRGEDGRYHAFNFHVLDLSLDGHITHAVLFFDTSLFPRFGLDPVLKR